jgi:aminocarboxymuconate-semialdehyde decarboxylase
VCDAGARRLLVDTVGPDKILAGSDYPYPLGERPAAGVVRTASFLDDGSRRKILSANAAAFLGRA